MKQLELLSLALVVSGSRAAYVPGAVCTGVDTFTTPASQMLIGRHLRVLDFEWPGFAMKKASAPHGWVGLDFDLLDLLQARLNFTYEVHEMISLEGETWEDMALRLAPQADLVLSYWSRTPRHLESLAFLAPHVDYAPVLVVKKDIVKEPSFWERFFQFARPFHPTIWALLMSMLCVSGGVDYLLEREQGGSLGASVYEYFAGTLWGGFQEPRSRLSAVYQIMLAFVLLITSESCGARPPNSTSQRGRTCVLWELTARVVFESQNCGSLRVHRQLGRLHDDETDPNAWRLLHRRPRCPAWPRVHPHRRPDAEYVRERAAARSALPQGRLLGHRYRAA